MLPVKLMPGFSWKKHTEALLQKGMYRNERLAKINPDFQLKHPDICNDLSKGDKTLLKKFVKEKIEKHLHNVQVPKVIRPTRLNRVI